QRTDRSRVTAPDRRGGGRLPRYLDLRECGRGGRPAARLAGDAGEVAGPAREVLSVAFARRAAVDRRRSAHGADDASPLERPHALPATGGEAGNGNATAGTRPVLLQHPRDSDPGAGDARRPAPPRG